MQSAANGTYRQPGWWRYVGLGLGAVFMLVALLCLVVGLASGDYWPILPMAFFFGGCGAAAIRPGLSSVTISDSFLEVVNWPRQHQLSWSDVVGVETRRTGVVRIRRREGRTLLARALSGNPAYSREWARPILQAITDRSGGPESARRSGS